MGDGAGWEFAEEGAVEGAGVGAGWGFHVDLTER